MTPNTLLSSAYIETGSAVKTLLRVEDTVPVMFDLPTTADFALDAVTNTEQKQSVVQFYFRANTDENAAMEFSVRYQGDGMMLRDAVAQLGIIIRNLNRMGGPDNRGPIPAKIIRDALPEAEFIERFVVDPFEAISE